MNQSVKWNEKARIERVIKALSINNMEGFYAETKEDVVNIIKKLVPKGSVIGGGGSVTLNETGVIEYFRNGDFTFYDRYKKNITPIEKSDYNRKALLSDTFITGTNAITEKGELFNVDGNGNRVAALIFGPKQVIVVVGKNKIVKDINEAESRMKLIAGPVDAKHLGYDNPCTKVGYCVDCKLDTRICNMYVTIKGQMGVNKDRIKVIIVNESLGF